MTDLSALDPASDMLAFRDAIGRVRETLAEWVRHTSEEMRDALEWQFAGPSKFFRPLTIFICYQAVYQ